jgi:ABC-2 type transport system permease protein
VLIIAGVVTDPHRERHLRQIAPMTAGLDIQATTRLVLRLRDA